MKKKPSGFTLIEILIVVAIIAALAAIGGSLFKSAKQKAHQSAALQKMKSLGATFATYTVDRNGLLPYEDSTGTDDWTNAARPENQEAWYNALPKLMGAKSVGELGLDESCRIVSGIPSALYPRRALSRAFETAGQARIRRRHEQPLATQG